MQGPIHHKDMKILNIYAPNNKASKCIKQKIDRTAE